MAGRLRAKRACSAIVQALAGIRGNQRVTDQNPEDKVRALARYSRDLTEAARLMEENGWTSALVVSDPWHLKRAVSIARSRGIEAHPSGTTTTRFESPKTRAGFLLRELYFYHRHLLLGR